MEMNSIPGVEYGLAALSGHGDDIKLRMFAIHFFSSLYKASVFTFLPSYKVAANSFFGFLSFIMALTLQFSHGSVIFILLVGLATNCAIV